MRLHRNKNGGILFQQQHQQQQQQQRNQSKNIKMRGNEESVFTTLSSFFYFALIASSGATWEGGLLFSAAFCALFDFHVSRALHCFSVTPKLCEASGSGTIVIRQSKTTLGTSTSTSFKVPRLTTYQWPTL
jgi:hypothetical protein